MMVCAITLYNPHYTQMFVLVLRQFVQSKLLLIICVRISFSVSINNNRCNLNYQARREH